MKISRAVPGDIPQLHKLISDAYRGEESKKGWTTEADLLDGIRTDEESLASLMAKRDAIFLTYKDDETIKGCVYLEKNNNKMYLGMLSVMPREQNKGIGKKLLSKSEKFALSQNCSFIEMTVISVRSELIGWYERKGFLQTGEIKTFPSDIKFGIPKRPLEFIVMRKKL